MKRPLLAASVVVAGVLAGAVLATAGARAQRQTAAPTLVVINGKVLNPDGTFSEAVAVRGNRILRVGSSQDITALKDATTETVDAHGRAVVPGFIDSHVHFLLGSESLTQLNLRGTRNRDEARERVKAYVAAQPGQTWIKGANGYGQLTGADLDEIVPDRPMFIVSSDVHSLLANARARAAAGITTATPDPANGHIARDPRTNEPTGVMLEAAQGLITRAVPPPTPDEWRRTLQRGIEEARRSGVTSIVNIGGPEDIALFDEARAKGTLGVRIYSALWVAPGGGDYVFPASVNATDADLDRFEEIRQRYKSDDLLKVGAIKIMLDGVIESRTAAMLSPYLDVPSKGTTTLSPERLQQIVTRMDRRGWQIITHALGDAAVRLALDSYDAAAKANPLPPRGRRHRIEHLEATDAADLPRFAKLGVIASLQPAHARGMLNPNPSGGRVLSIGPERHASGWPWKRIADQGGRIVFGSDWPVASLNPTLSFYVPLTRGPRPGVPDERLSMAAVVDAYTRTAAWAEFEDANKGAIEAGKLADLVVLSNDIFATPPATADAVAVDVTVFDGRVVFTR